MPSQQVFLIIVLFLLYTFTRILPLRFVTLGTIEPLVEVFAKMNGGWKLAGKLFGHLNEESRSAGIAG